MNFAKYIEKSKIFLFYIFLFLISDAVYSNFFYNSNYKSNCTFSHNKLTFLEKNCSFKQKYIRRVSPYNVLTDKFGFRSSGKKFNSNKENIFYFGDSFAYGLGLDYSKTFVGKIEKAKNDYNHLNFSLQGYSPTVYLYQFKEMIKKKIYPKKIILSLDFTDIFEEINRQSAREEINETINAVYSANSTTIFKEDFNDNTFKKKNFKASVFIAQSINSFFRNIRLLISQKISEPTLEPGKTTVGNFLYTPFEDLNTTFSDKSSFSDVIKSISVTIKEIGNLSKDLETDLYILIYPYPDTMRFGQKYFNWEEYAKNICIESGCKKLLNSFPAFDEFKNKNEDWLGKLFIDGDLHHSELGHTIISELIISELN